MLGTLDFIISLFCIPFSHTQRLLFKQKLEKILTNQIKLSGEDSLSRKDSVPLLDDVSGAVFDVDVDRADDARLQLWRNDDSTELDFVAWHL